MTSVAIQGEPGCFSHAAAVQTFGLEVPLSPSRDFPSLFADVVSGSATHGAVPVENTLAGAVVENLDLLTKHPVHIVSEVYVRVELCLVVPPGSDRSAIRTAASHPVALQQCRSFFDEHREIVPQAVYDTAGSVRDLMEGRATYEAAIGPALAASIYGGDLLERGIEDHSRNFTRFFIVAPGRVEDDAPKGSKASMAFTLPHQPGALHRALGILAEGDLDLTRLESRPIPGEPWRYRFFADVRGLEGTQWVTTMRSLRAYAEELVLFGTYSETPVP